MKTYFTYAPVATISGKQKIEIVVKMFRLFLTYEELQELNLTLNFYLHEMEKKPKAKFIVFSTMRGKGFGFGIFTAIEIKEGKKVSKEQKFSHEYLTIDEFIFKIVKYFKAKKRQ